MPIYLIRHGHTAGNAARRLQVPETPLDDVGLDQAHRLGERLRDHAIELVLSSDLTRARMTAERLQAACGAPLALEPLLQERDFGDARGKLYHEAAPDVFGPDYAPPNGETWKAFWSRGARAWERVAEVYEQVDGDLAVVTHGLLYQFWLAMCIELPVPWGAEPPAIARPVPRIENTGVTIVHREPSVAGRSGADAVRWRASRVGCVDHLPAR